MKISQLLTGPAPEAIAHLQQLRGIVTSAGDDVANIVARRGRPSATHVAGIESAVAHGTELIGRAGRGLEGALGSRGAAIGAELTADLGKLKTAIQPFRTAEPSIVSRVLDASKLPSMAKLGSAVDDAIIQLQTARDATLVKRVGGGVVAGGALALVAAAQPDR